MSGCICSLDTVFWFLGCYTWVDIICIWGILVFWIALLSPLSSWDDMIVRVKLLVYGVWVDEEEKTGFLSVGVNIFDQLYLKKRPIYLTMVTMSTIKQIYAIWDYVGKLNKIEIWFFFINNQNILFGLSAPKE